VFFSDTASGQGLFVEKKMPSAIGVRLMKSGGNQNLGYSEFIVNL
jgi:hypothetical protein